MGLRVGVRTGQRHCPRCKMTTKVERNTLVWGSGDSFLAVMTVGLWIPIKIVYNKTANPWRCATCGERV